MMHEEATHEVIATEVLSLFDDATDFENIPQPRSVLSPSPNIRLVIIWKQGFDSLIQSFENLLSPIATQIAMIIDKAAMEQTFEALQVRIDFDAHQEAFLAELATRAQIASGMACVVYRELRKSSKPKLACLMQVGLNMIEERLASLDINPIPANIFDKVFVRQEQYPIAFAHNSEPQGFPTPEETLHILSTTMCPVVVGPEVIGTLSFGAARPWAITNRERRQLELITLEVGSSLQAYRYHLDRQRFFADMYVSSSAATILDMLQDSRHLARETITSAKVEIQTSIRMLQKHDPIVGSQSRHADNVTILTSLAEAEQSCITAAAQLDRLAALQPSQKDAEEVQLKKLWEEAFSLAGGRLKDLGIKYNITGNANALLRHDRLVSAFLNLIMNSLDAYGRKRQTRREIHIRITEASKNEFLHDISYEDWAGGLQVAELEGKSQRNLRAHEAIFEPGVTTKGRGNGFGMWLTRKIIQQEGGNIFVVEHRGGMLFKLELPKVSAASKLD